MRSTDDTDKDVPGIVGDLGSNQVIDAEVETQGGAFSVEALLNATNRLQLHEG
ncbi:MAG TPA: hypothetical protein VGS11_10720 [Candidatus Bathyarchaeia archaeon]|nr:hypothetical protein [Candidatus Bathyarchaeia archaeon]